MACRPVWDCVQCGAENSFLDGECQHCECLGAECKRDNCSWPDHKMWKSELPTPTCNDPVRHVGCGYLIDGVFTETQGMANEIAAEFSYMTDKSIDILYGCGARCTTIHRHQVSDILGPLWPYSKSRREAARVL